MDKIVYQNLRAEMTAYFTSFRNFELGQYSISVIVFSILMSETNFVLIAIKSFVIIGFIFIVTKICTELHNKATRIGSYILVAYEMKEMKSKLNKKDNSVNYWILANRSLSFLGIGEKEKDKTGFRKNLANFYFRQIIVIIFFGLLANFMLTYIYIKYDQWISLTSIDIISIGLFELFLIICLIRIFNDRNSFKDYGKEQIQKWKEYCDSRKKFDESFLTSILLKK